MTKLGDMMSSEDPLNFDARGTNQTGMRARNELLVLSLVRQSGALPKADIARITGLSAQTVSVIMRELEQEGLLERGEKVRGKIGQPSIPMKIARNGAFFFGLKLGRRSAEVVLIDFLGNIVDRSSQTYQYPKPSSILEFLNLSVDQLTQSLSQEDQKKIKGLGVAMPFFLWEWATIIGVDEREMAAWKDFDIKSEIEALLNIPTFVENDATSACGAELVFGNPRLPKDFLYFYLGYFVGGGVVFNGKLFRGPSGNAASVGTMPMPTGGSSAKQLVDMASLAGLERRLIDQNIPSSHMWDSSTDWNFDETILTDWISEASAALAHAIVSAISVIDFEHILIDGWFPTDVREKLVQSTRDHVLALNYSGSTIPEVHAGTVGADARVLGAASLPLSHRYLPSAE